MTNEQENYTAEESQVEDVSTTQTEANDQEQEAESTQDDTVTLTKSEFTKLKRQAIAYKSQKENQPAPLKERNGSSDINRDELFLVAKGYDDDAIAQLQIIARGSGVGLREALENPLFKNYEAKQKEEERRAKAKLGASNGSGFSQGGSVIRPGMTEAEHKAAFEKLMSGK